MRKYLRRSLDTREYRRRWLDPRLSSIHVDGIRAYLLGKGWKEVPPDRDGFVVFEEPDADPNHPLYQFVPDSEEDDVYPTLIHELIAALASFEDRYAGDVLTDILRCQGAVESNGKNHEHASQEAVAK